MHCMCCMCWSVHVCLHVWLYCISVWTLTLGAWPSHRRLLPCRRSKQEWDPAWSRYAAGRRVASLSYRLQCGGTCHHALVNGLIWASLRSAHTSNDAWVSISFDRALRVRQRWHKLAMVLQIIHVNYVVISLPQSCLNSTLRGPTNRKTSIPPC